MKNRSLLITLLLVLTLLVTACSSSGKQNNSPAGTGTAAVPNTGPGTGTTTPAAGSATGMATAAGTGTGTPSAAGAVGTGTPSAAGQATETAPASMGAATATGQATTAASGAAGTTTTPVATTAGAAGTTTTPAATSAANANGASGTASGVIGIPQTGTNGLVGLAAMFDFKVVDTQGSPIGTVKDYIVNTCESNLLYIAVTPASGGGNASSGANQVLLVPYQATLVTPNQGKVDAANHTFVINVKAADLTSAPTVDLSTLDLQNPTWDATVQSFWGSRVRLALTAGCNIPAPAGAASGGAAQTTPGAVTGGATGTSVPGTTTPGAMNIVTTTPAAGQSNGSVPATGGNAQATTAATPGAATPGATTPGAAGTSVFPTRSPNRQTIFRIALASKILGAELQDGNAVPLGTVKDAAVVPATGRLQYLLVQPQASATPNAAAQNGAKLVALPLGAVNIKYNNAGQSGASGAQPVFVLLVKTSIYQSAPTYNPANNTNDTGWFDYWQKYIPMTMQQLP